MTSGSGLRAAAGRGPRVPRDSEHWACGEQCYSLDLVRHNFVARAAGKELNFHQCFCLNATWPAKRQGAGAAEGPLRIQRGPPPPGSHPRSPVRPGAPQVFPRPAPVLPPSPQAESMLETSG